MKEPAQDVGEPIYDDILIYELSRKRRIETVDERLDTPVGGAQEEGTPNSILRLRD